MEIDMLGDPEFFDIENKKLFGIWPHDQLISKGINPYVKRIRQDKIAMLVVGDHKGESVYDFLSDNEKIVKINVVNVHDDISESQTLKELFKKNTEKFANKIDKGISKDKQRDVVCIDKTACTAENLELYYQNVKRGGIFCGNGHGTQEVKVALSEFRRKIKIGTPIQICHKNIWFWYAR
jgi:ribosomal protein L7Ae-like RNA K-turn-binding protein